MKWVVCLLGFFICGATLAEMRLWEDKKGNVLEAEYKCEVLGKVVLRDRKGKDHTLSISSLSDKDQQYLQTKLPPKIDIKFKKLQDRRRNSYSWATVTMHGEIVLTKTSRMPYSGDLKATLFMIGEDSHDDEYVMLDRVDFEFNFRTAKRTRLEGKGSRCRSIAIRPMVTTVLNTRAIWSLSMMPMGMS